MLRGTQRYAEIEISKRVSLRCVPPMDREMYGVGVVTSDILFESLLLPSALTVCVVKFESVRFVNACIVGHGLGLVSSPYLPTHG